MGLALFGGGGQPQDVVFLPAVVDVYPVHPRLFESQGAGLIENNGVDRGQALQRSCLLDQHSVFRGNTQKAQHAERTQNPQVVAGTVQQDRQTAFEAEPRRGYG